MNSNSALARRRLDARFSELPEPARFAVPALGWIRAIREALGMTRAQLGERMGIRAQSVLDMEGAEASAQIQLSTLKRAAEALDCTLVYALVPKSSLARTVEQQAHKVASRALARADQSMKLEDQTLDESGYEERLRRYVEDVLRDRDLWK